MIQVLYVWSGDLYLDDSGTILCPLLKIQVIQVIQIWMILTGDGSHTLRGEGCLNILSWSWSTHYDCIVETLNKVGWISVCGGIPTISQRQGTGDTPLLSGIWANQRPVSWSPDHSQPIRGQYAGHHPGIWARFHSIEDYRHTRSMASNSSNISNKLKRENSRREWICGH